jgi:hypothetical protein
MNQSLFLGMLVIKKAWVLMMRMGLDGDCSPKNPTRLLGEKI